MRRVLPLLPAVALLPAAGLLWAHDATWSIWLGLAVAALGGLYVVAVANGRYAVVLALVGAGLVAVGTDAAASGWWMGLVGVTDEAIVSHVDHVGLNRGSPAHDDDTVVLADGTAVAGPLRDLRPGSLAVGDRVDVRHDPTGLVRFPVGVDDRHHARDAVGGPVAVLVGLGLLVVLRLRRPDPTAAADTAVPGGPPGRPGS